MSISLTAADLDGDGIADTLGDGNYDPGDALRESRGAAPPSPARAATGTCCGRPCSTRHGPGSSPSMGEVTN